MDCGGSSGWDAVEGGPTPPGFQSLQDQEMSLATAAQHLIDE